MAHYRAVMIHPKTGGEGRYDFETSEGLMDKSPAKVLHRFLEIVDEKFLPAEHIDYEINAAIKNESGTVVSGMGVIILESGARLPFVALINEKDA